MYITDTDNELLRFVEENGSITISQAQNMYYNTQKFGYEISRRRISKLVKYGKLKFTRNNEIGQNIYYIDKPLRTHDVLIMDFYAKLVNNGARIVYFKSPQYWQTVDSLRSDAFAFYFIGNKPYFNIIELVRTHEVEREKYHRLFDNGEANVLCNELYKHVGSQNINVFPRMIILDDVQHKQGYYYDEKIKMVQLDLKMTNFVKIFI